MMGGLTPKGPVSLALDETGKGVLIYNGISYSVRWSGNVSTKFGLGKVSPQRITFDLGVEEVLDEKQQRAKIEQLRRQLAIEQDKLAGIQDLVRSIGTGVDEDTP